VLDRITPVVLTFNEEPNIGRTLERLSWARDIVVVDSGSTDATRTIAADWPAVRVFTRPFDAHARQWNFAVHETGIATDWVLALDADYVLTEALVDELRGLSPDSTAAGYRAGFRYCVLGRPLRGTLYPPVTVLFRGEQARYEQDGHTQRVRVDGPVSSLTGRILHDDRKPLSRWLCAQDGYMRLEADLIASKAWGRLSLADRLRRMILIAPFAVFLYVLVVKGVLLDGRPGLYYALQRLLAEALLSLRILERRMRAP
jgi:glycosyltransferase involved in cell wall biosynthesis